MFSVVIITAFAVDIRKAPDVCHCCSSVLGVSERDEVNKLVFFNTDAVFDATVRLMAISRRLSV